MNRISLQTGNKGQDVAQLQQLLKSQGFDPGTVDGVFGTNTRNAVMAFQAAHGLTVDGVVGTQTWTALVPTSKAQAGLFTAPSSGTSWTMIGLVVIGAMVAWWMFSRKGR